MQGNLADYPKLEKFLDIYPEPIVVGLGSSVVVNPEKIYDAAILAAMEMKKGIILVGGEGYEPQFKIDNSVFISGYIPLIYYSQRLVSLSTMVVLELLMNQLLRGIQY
jgi:UDP:flavonoid glycosyltransferase YjiC (YdhE family)